MEGLLEETAESKGNPLADMIQQFFAFPAQIPARPFLSCQQTQPVLSYAALVLQLPHLRFTLSGGLAGLLLPLLCPAADCAETVFGCGQ
ncbi:hypothetical protein D3C75_983030 [compost metagenome]